MHDDSPVRDAVDALVARVGTPAPGRPGLVVAAPGAGKTPLLLHLAQRAVASGHLTIVLALGTTLAHLRAQHAAIVDTGWGADADAARRLLLLAVPRDTAADALVAQAEALASSGAFAAARLVVDGLPATAGALGALAEGSRRLGLPTWAALTLDGPVPDALRVLSGPVVRLEGDGATVHLRDGDGAMLPWALDATTLAVRPSPGVVGQRLRMLHGGADGAEAAFGAAASAAGHEERTLTWPGRVPARAVGLVVLDEATLDATGTAVEEAERILDRRFRDSRALQRVLRLQACLAEAADDLLAVGDLQDDGTMSGGTGWAVEVAKRRRRRLWVFDQRSSRWMRWNGEAWELGEPALVGPVVAGTGTRHLTPEGAAAVAAVFA